MSKGETASEPGALVGRPLRIAVVVNLGLHPALVVLNERESTSCEQVHVLSGVAGCQDPSPLSSLPSDRSNTRGFQRHDN